MKRRSGLIALWACLVACDSATKILMKMGTGRLSGAPLSAEWFRTLVETPLIWLALLCQIVTFVLWLRILSATRLGIAFATTSLTIIGVLVLSRIFLGESLSPVSYFGAALIILGVLLLRPLETSH